MKGVLFAYGGKEGSLCLFLFASSTLTNRKVYAGTYDILCGDENSVKWCVPVCFLLHAS